MSYFNICPDCGAYLDPGECCDCLLNSLDNIYRTSAVEDPDLGKVPLYTLTEPTPAERKHKVMETNRHSFENTHHRQPRSDFELLLWVYNNTYEHDGRRRLIEYLESAGEAEKVDQMRRINSKQIRITKILTRAGERELDLIYEFANALTL